MTPPKALLAHAYAADSATTGAASSVTDSSATVSGSTETGGGPVNAHVEFGTTTAYGSVTPNQRLDALAAGRTFSAALTGLPAGTTIHYRVVVSTDFGTITGADATFTTAAAQGGGGTGGGGNNGGKATTVAATTAATATASPSSTA